MNIKFTIALLFVLTVDFAPSTLTVFASASAVPTPKTDTAKLKIEVITQKICRDKDGNYYNCP
jgi:hypothetical protein